MSSGGGVLPNQTVLVTDGVIRHVGPSADVASVAATTVDGRGAYLMPGLIDTHAHLRGGGVPGPLITEWMMPLIVAHGVTGVREMASMCERPEEGPVCAWTNSGRGRPRSRPASGSGRGCWR